MPELPEVEIVRRGLADLLPGLSVVGLKSFWDRSFQSAKTDVDAFLIGSKIVEVRRRAKVLMIDLDTGYSLVIHLKMTGQLVFRSDDDSIKFGAGHPTDSLVGKLPDKSTRVILELTGAKLFFNDQRKFGWIKLMPTIEIQNIKFFQKVGPEPFNTKFTQSIFIERIQKRAGTTIKGALLDQTVLAGVGNIYADEALWGAKIHPGTRVRDVPTAKLKKLFNEIKTVLSKSIEHGGSTDRNYVNAKGQKGSYMTFARVFRREGQPCLRCGTMIDKIRVAGRGTHICPRCQKI